MTAAGGSDGAATVQLSRQLSLLPAALGVLAMGVLLAVGRIVLADEPTWTRPVLLVAVAAVAVTVVSGHPIGLYVGMVLGAIAMLGGESGSSTWRLAVAAVGLLLVHEIVRPSLDARRPVRFGRRVWFRSAAVTVLLACFVAGTVVAARAIAAAEDLPTWLVPIGLASCGLPLLARRLAPDAGATGSDHGRPTLAGDRPARGSVALRTVVALVVVGAALAGVVAGATARSEIENVREPSTTPTELVPTEEPLLELDDASVVERGAALLLFFIVLVIAGVLFVAFRRPEKVFDLDDLDLDIDESTLGLAGPGEADLDDQVVIDEHELDRLLADLAIDLSSELDPGRAVRYGYANIERRLGELGVARGPSETEQELLVRAIPALGADGVAMTDLTTLFERARFGHEPVTEAMRQQAVAAVEQLRRATASEPGP